MVTAGLLLTALVLVVYILAVLAPKRDRTDRSKTLALKLVPPADERAARECADFHATTGGVAASARPNPSASAGTDREQPPDAGGGGKAGTPTAVPSRSSPGFPNVSKVVRLPNGMRTLEPLVLEDEYLLDGQHRREAFIQSPADHGPFDHATSIDYDGSGDE